MSVYDSIMQGLNEAIEYEKGNPEICENTHVTQVFTYDEKIAQRLVGILRSKHISNQDIVNILQQTFEIPEEEALRLIF